MNFVFISWYFGAIIARVALWRYTYNEIWKERCKDIINKTDVFTLDCPLIEDLTSDQVLKSEYKIGCHCSSLLYHFTIKHLSSGNQYYTHTSKLDMTPDIQLEDNLE